jgi:Icc-related predicted phosphoesterase
MAKRRHYYTNIALVNGNLDPEFVAALNNDIDELYRNISDENVVQISVTKIISRRQNNITISTTETQIPHLLGRVPQVLTVIPKNNATWWQVKDPDSAYIYLQASSDLVADIIVQG